MPDLDKNKFGFELFELQLVENKTGCTRKSLVWILTLIKTVLLGVLTTQSNMKFSCTVILIMCMTMEDMANISTGGRGRNDIYNYCLPNYRPMGDLTAIIIIFL